MKQYRRRITLGLCMAACLLLLAACGKQESAGAIGEAEQQYLSQNAQGMLQQIAELSDEDIDYIIEQASQSGNEGDAVLASGLESWKSVEADLGALKSIGETKVEQTEDGYTVSVRAEFEKRGMEFNLGQDKQMSTLTFMSFNPVYTVGEKLQQAGMNTLMGMGTVFVILIFISLLIGCFKYINRFEESMKKKNAREVEIPVPMAVPVSPIAKREEEEKQNGNLADDCELVAVITAAIAASGGSSPSGLVVRSIRRVSSSKWKKA